MSKQDILIFEFVSGGGFNQVDIPISLFCEGFGMLRSIIADFKALDFEIYTILDSRIYFLSRFLQADIIKEIDPKENYLKIFKTLVQECKYAFIIAPEFSNILYDLTKIVKNHNKILLSTNLEGIRIGTSKIITHNFFKNSEIPTPKTYLIPYKEKNLDYDFIIEKFNKFKKPIVIKPEEGVGAESIYYFETENQIKEFFLSIKDIIEYERNYIIQEYIEGRDLSLSLIGASYSLNSQVQYPLILSVNFQDINIKSFKYKSEYFGGYTPVENQKEVIKELDFFFRKFNLSKFNGYFGIDFISKSDKSPCFIEINPRLTTSYVGLRNTINQNPAKLILNSKLNCVEPTDIKHIYYSHFSKIEMIFKEAIINDEFNEVMLPKLIREIPEFVTPPISLGKTKQFSCFIATKTKDLNSSRRRMKEIIQLLKKLDFKIIKSK